MNQKPKALVALISLLCVGLSAPAAEFPVNTPSITAHAQPVAPPAAPSILTRNRSLDAADIEKYERLAEQAQDLATGEAAGASARTTLIVVAVIVATAAVVALASNNVGAGLPAYTGPM